MSRSMLLLGTGNTTRSIMAEAYINHASHGRWRAHSAGTEPGDEVHPLALKALAEAGIPLPHRPVPKSHVLFADPGGPSLDVIVSLCEEVADESLLAWPGSPRIMHWPVPNPAQAPLPQEERLEIFRAVLELIRRRADDFLSHDQVRLRRT
jgi:arsenate reductase (thioredoxin)